MPQADRTSLRSTSPRVSEDAFDAERLDRRILEWRRRHEVLDAEVATSRRELAATVEAYATAVGQGVGGKGAVRAACDARNRLLDLAIDPAALRLGSIEALRDAVLEAVGSAQADVAAQLERAAGGAPGEAPVDRLPELAELYAARVHSSLAGRLPHDGGELAVDQPAGPWGVS